MSKFCGNCGAELGQDGICPNCDTKRKKKSKKAFVIIPVLLIIIGIIATILLNGKSVDTVAPGNFSSRGLVGSYKDNVYYSIFKDGLYCEKSGGKAELLTLGTYCNLTIDGKYLYYVELQTDLSKYFVHKMDLDSGKVKTVYETNDRILNLCKIDDMEYI